ncbi:RibD family protein [Bradyrhizobium prioriisuperbiae]|uniref:RibD family protein n=1 Tax=Bradyrhizobium prioriisuperbiae TaxID=2854389 RepID=UPI0028E8D55D|nr:RibD family protein [Bradyrhizobium prioritasuperba]
MLAAPAQTPLVPNHSGRNPMIFMANWAIGAFLSDRTPTLISPVQLSSIPTSKFAPGDHWEEFVHLFRRGQQTLPQVWGDVFGPLRKGAVDDLVIVGQVGQSLDGRIATASGHSKYINCPAGIDHLHRLRALVDIVVVGVGTAIADDPQLTVRQVAGPQPVRAVIDPQGRLKPCAKLFRDDGVRRILITAEGTRCTPPPGVEIVALPAHEGNIAPADIVGALARAGMRRILIEGGADTVSRFLVSRCLDRLHVTVAPVILGSGGPGIALPSLERADEAPRMPVRVHRIAEDVLFDCDLTAQRIALGVAKTST